jgi:hypothetical protein
VFSQLLYTGKFVSADNDIATAAQEKLAEVLPDTMEGTGMDVQELIRTALCNPPGLKM